MDSLRSHLPDARSLRRLVISVPCEVFIGPKSITIGDPATDKLVLSAYVESCRLVVTTPCLEVRDELIS